MTSIRYFITVLLLLAWGSGEISAQLPAADLATPEMALAEIRIGMRRSKVVGLLGDQTGFYLAQPPIDMQLPDESRIDVRKEIPKNSIIFVTNKDNMDSVQQEAVFGPAGDPEKAETQTYWWAEVVKSTRLALDQRVLVYWINETYVLAMTIKGEGPDAPVSDVVACSFAPFLVSTGKPINKARPLDFRYKYKMISRDLTPRTALGISIGDNLKKVLMTYGWPDYCLPYVSSDLPPIRIVNGHYEIASMKAVVNTAITATPSADPGAAPAQPAAGGAADTTTPAAPKVIPPMASFWGLYATGRSSDVTFTKSCYLIYPKQRVAFTLVDFTVVRIQIGLGITTPQIPDTPIVWAPGMEAVQTNTGPSSAPPGNGPPMPMQPRPMQPPVAPVMPQPPLPGPPRPNAGVEDPVNIGAGNIPRWKQ